MKNEISRREMLRISGLAAAGIPLINLLPKDIHAKPIIIPLNPEFREPDKPVTAVVIGAGARGNIYSGYGGKFPKELKIVGVAEPIEFRRKRFAEQYGIPKEHQWVTWEHAMQVPKFADAMIITTPDHLHYGPAMAALSLGYDLLLEKPIAQTWNECNDILKLALKKNAIVAVCHVLRYTAYFRKFKEIMESGILGDIASVQHLEPVLHEHMAHSFVRGNWRNTKESNFMLNAKSCHDLDILRWTLDKHCTRVSSFGSLKHFKAGNAPAGNTTRCTDGCKAEASCPYSALKIYYRKRSYLWHFDFPEKADQGEVIMKNLKEGPYGRCVYHCDNDVVDHQIVNLEFEDQITASFNMEAFTSYSGRRTRVFGTMGDIVGDENILTVSNFRTDKAEVWDTSKIKIDSGHGGGDYGLAHDFVQAVSQHKPELLTSTISASMESHLMGFRAEESRLTGKIIDVKMD
jgi:predicted dehydrogenase